MGLRKLQDKDAPFMLEWMHDESVVRYLKKDFALLTLDDCKEFISAAQNESDNMHLAIVNAVDEYVGTVSLKNINKAAIGLDKDLHYTAEMGIVIRRCMMGKGYASSAMKEIFEYGFKSKDIEYIYWCVDPVNERAVHFYDKNDYKRCDAPVQIYGYTEEEKQRFIWYTYRLSGMEFSNEQSI